MNRQSRKIKKTTKTKGLKKAPHWPISRSSTAIALSGMRGRTERPTKRMVLLWEEPVVSPWGEAMAATTFFFATFRCEHGKREGEAPEEKEARDRRDWEKVELSDRNPIFSQILWKKIPLDSTLSFSHSAAPSSPLSPVLGHPHPWVVLFFFSFILLYFPLWRHRTAAQPFFLCEKYVRRRPALANLTRPSSDGEESTLILRWMI